MRRTVTPSRMHAFSPNGERIKGMDFILVLSGGKATLLCQWTDEDPRPDATVLMSGVNPAELISSLQYAEPLDDRMSYTRMYVFITYGPPQLRFVVGARRGDLMAALTGGIR